MGDDSDELSDCGFVLSSSLTLLQQSPKSSSSGDDTASSAQFGKPGEQGSGFFYPKMAKSAMGYITREQFKPQVGSGEVGCSLPGAMTTCVRATYSVLSGKTEYGIWRRMVSFVWMVESENWNVEAPCHLRLNI